MNKTKATLTAQDFITYGMGCPTLADLASLGSDNIEILIFVPTDSGEVVPLVEEGFYSSEIYWAVSPNNTDWYVYKDSSWKGVSLAEFVDEEFTYSELNAVSQTAWNTLCDDGEIYFKACLISNKEGSQPAILSIRVNTLQSYASGFEAVYSGDSLSLNTEMWLTLDSILAYYSTPPGTNIYFLFSTDGKQRWKTLNNSNIWSTSTLEAISTEGISISRLLQIQPEVWKNLFPMETLDIAVALWSEDPAVTPTISEIVVNHTEYEAITSSNIIAVPTPSVPYKRMVIGEDYQYEEVTVEGIGFDDKAIADYWFTTPNKIHLRVYSLPTLIGTKTSEFFMCKVRNTYEVEDFDVVLTARYNGIFAEPFESLGYGLLPDSTLQSEKTKIEFSRDGGQAYANEYPMRFVLMHKGYPGKKDEKIFYFRLTPTVTTVGRVNAEIVATYTHHTPD